MVDYLREIGIILFFLYASVILIGSLLSFSKARKNSKAMEKRDIYTYSMALFFLLIGIGLIIRIYFMFFLAETPEEFILQLTATERSVETLPSYANDGRLALLQILWQIQVGFTTGGIACLMYGTETQIIKKTKFSLTIIELILTPLLIFTPYSISHKLYYISFIPPLVWIVLYFIIARKTTGTIRRNALVFLIGFIIFFGGAGLNSGSARAILFGSSDLYVSEATLIFTCWISPLAMMFGFILMLYGILKKV